MSPGDRYKTPQAARTAVTDRLRAQARESPWQLGDLQRQYAYDQLVERLYRLDERWVIKGATALLARKVSVRHTIDIDVYRRPRSRDMDPRLQVRARRTVGLDAMELDEALAIVREFLDPLLAGKAAGDWKQDLRLWG